MENNLNEYKVNIELKLNEFEYKIFKDYKTYFRGLICLKIHEKLADYYIVDGVLKAKYNKYYKSYYADYVHYTGKDIIPNDGNNGVHMYKGHRYVTRSFLIKHCKKYLKFFLFDSIENIDGFYRMHHGYVPLYDADKHIPEWLYIELFGVVKAGDIYE